MKDQVNRIEYFAINVDDKPGAGADLGTKLKQEGVNLLALSAFPAGPGRTQLDLVPESPEQLTKAARKIGITLGQPKAAFLVQGTDRPGAMAEVGSRLGNAKINIRATIGVCGGGNRYGGLIWVDQKDVEAAAKALGATSLTAHHV